MTAGKGLGRREFLKGAAASALLTAFGPQAPAETGGAGPTGERPPNILVIMSDEHNASVLGCYGNPIVRTPNLDGLAARGVVFESAYTNSPLCVPCRLSFTAGKYISHIGAWGNSCWLADDNIPSIARVMSAAGYDSILCGKMHYDASRRYGFTEIGQVGNRSFMTGKGSRRAPDDLQPKPHGLGRFASFHTGDDSGIMAHDRKVAEGTIQFLASRTPADKPFFMIAGYIAPHFPLIVPEPYWAPYQGKIPMPEIPDGFLESLPLNYKHLRIGFQVENVEPEIVRKGRELYYGLTQWLDEQVGRVLAALEEGGLADNTVVIYTADHGENMGEHGLWWKNAVYQQAARVPLIISWPKRWAGGQRRTEACSLVDVVQTIAALGGAKTPPDWDGDSMAAWLDNGAAKWKDRAISEYYAHCIASGYVMLREGQYKYVYHTPPDDKHPAERELYDLKADPGEFKNLAKDPAQRERIEQMHADLVAELGEDPDVTEQRCRADLAKGYGREQPKSARKAKTDKEKMKAKA